MLARQSYTARSYLRRDRGHYFRVYGVWTLLQNTDKNSMANAVKSLYSSSERRKKDLLLGKILFII